MSKEISNPYSTGGGGIHFENRVQSAFTVLMLARGVSPCLPPWPITELKIQGKYQGFETDDLIVYCSKPNSSRKSKLLGQIKHTISFTLSDETFKEVIVAAWNDFNNKEIFSEETGDVIALICGPLSSVDTNSVRPLLEQARSSKDSNDFLNRIKLAKFTSDDQREKLKVFRGHLKTANNDEELTDDQLYRFLKSFHLLIYDLDIKGVVYSLLHTLIEQYSQNNSKAIWAQINEHIEWMSAKAASITLENIPEEIKIAFKKIQVEAIPKEFVKDTSKIVVSDWNINQSAPELALACLVGSWNENSAADKSILSQLARLEYERWIPKLREILQIEGSPVVFKNGIWNVKNRKELWQNLGSRIFDDNIDTLKKCIVTVLTERDPKFELPKEDRYASSIYGKVLKFSPRLRTGLAESLALLGCLPEDLNNCSLNKAETTAILGVREIFNNADWVLWASLTDLLPLLAEAAPDEFLNAVENHLQQENTPFKEIFAQEGVGIFGWNYLTGLLWALETLAWEETYLVRVTILLGELAKIDPGGNWANRPSNTLRSIFLPWLPQTTASIEKRMVAIKTLDKELPSISWELLLSILPNVHQVSSYTRKPKFRNSIPSNWNEKVTNIDYWRQIEFFAELAVEKAKDNLVRLEKLIDNLDNLPKTAFENLLSHLSSEKITSQKDEIKVNIWNSLVDFTSKHKLYSDAKWALPSGILEKIDTVAEKLKPKDPLYYYARLFTSRDVDLYEARGNWEEQDRKLDERRQKAVKEILDSGGLNNVLNFLDNVDAPVKVGSALGGFSDHLIDEKLLPFYLDTDNRKVEQFISAYVWRKFHLHRWNWVDKLISMTWSKIQLSRFLTFLPFTLETWKRVSEKLSDSDSLYWEKTNVNPYHSEGDMTIAIDKLIEYRRPHAAIYCIFKTVYDKKPLDITRSISALKAGLNSQEPINTMDSYHITEIIKVLQQDSSVNEDELFRVEWAYLPLLDEHNNVTPRTLEFRLASDPEFFCEVIRLIYRSKKMHEQEEKETQEQNENILKNAWDLLYKWRTPPGTQRNGSFDEQQFKSWLETVIEKCEETGHLEVALINTGKILYYSPSDPTGFWINKTVAEVLNRKDTDEIRSGYRTEVFNSRGFHFVDPTGKQEFELAELYRKLADETENNGYQRFAVTLRRIAESYENDARRIIEEHKKELEELSEDG
jgi:hypothetical protein